MAKPDIATEVNLTLKFFTALGRDDDEEVLRLFKSASLDPTGMQSSKAKTFVDSGECDSKDKLQIRLISDSYFNGWIGSTSVYPSGVDQFCRKYYCTIASHRKAQFHILPHYWYIQAGPKSMSGFFVTPKLISDKFLGPTTGLFEACSKDPTCHTFTGPTLGQWKFLFNSWK